MDDDTLRFAKAMGQAALAEWPDLPQDVQEKLFERAVREGGPGFREALAVFLHHHHPRTASEYRMPQGETKKDS